MKFKKILFPIMLILAIVLTTAGILSISKSFAVPDGTHSIKSFDLTIDNIETNNIEVIDYNLTYIKYKMELNENKKEYSVSFDVVNKGNISARLNSITIQDLPSNILPLVKKEVVNNNKISVNDKDRITIKYLLKDDLTKEEKELLNEFSKVSINVILDYTEA